MFRRTPVCVRQLTHPPLYRTVPHRARRTKLHTVWTKGVTQTNAWPLQLLDLHFIVHNQQNFG